MRSIQISKTQRMGPWDQWSTGRNGGKYRWVWWLSVAMNAWNDDMRRCANDSDVARRFSANHRQIWKTVSGLRICWLCSRIRYRTNWYTMHWWMSHRRRRLCAPTPVRWHRSKIFCRKVQAESYRWVAGTGSATHLYFQKILAICFLCMCMKAVGVFWNISVGRIIFRTV